MTTATNTQILHQPGPNHRPGAARTPIFLPSRSARASGGPLLTSRNIAVGLFLFGALPDTCQIARPSPPHRAALVCDSSAPQGLDDL
jgi:hypothetical protein